MIRSAILSTAATVLTLGTSAAIAQQTSVLHPSAQAHQAVAPQAWTPTYFYDSAGALWLVYIPAAPAHAPTAPTAAAAAPVAPAQTQAAAPVQTRAQAPVQGQAGAPAAANQQGAQTRRSMVSPKSPEQGTGRNVRMHKPWMKGRR